MRKNIIYILCILLSSLLFVSCTNKDTLNSTQNERQSYQLKKSLTDSIEVDATVTGPSSNTLPIYSAHILEPTTEQVQKAFFSDVDSKALTITPKTEEVDGVDGFRIAEDEKRSFNYARGGYQVYMNYDHINYYLLITYYQDLVYHLPKDFTSVGIEDAKNLSFMTKKDATSLVREAASDIGFSLEDEPFTCIALNKESLQTLYDKMDGNPQLFYTDQDVSFKDDNGCYYILWYLTAENGEPVYSANYSPNTLLRNGDCVGSYVFAIVNKEGIVSFETRNSFIIDEEKSKENLIDVDTALDCFKEKYISNESFTVTDIYFCYTYILVDKHSMTYDAVPTWCILSHNLEDDSYSLTSINAVTGNLL
jgi:hypothetical protein